MLLSVRDWLLVHDYSLTLIKGQFLPATFSYVLLVHVSYIAPGLEKEKGECT